METKEEYHDPDYPEASVSTQEGSSNLTEKEKIEKIKNIILREFGNELELRENEVMLANQRMQKARRVLCELRYQLVLRYYKDQKLQLTPVHLQDEVVAQNEPRTRTEVTSLLRDGQRRIHPSLRKLLGKKSVDLEEILKIREPRKKAKKNYSAMIHSRNYTVAADSTKSLRPESHKPPEEKPMIPEESETIDKPKKIPRHLDPKVENVVTLVEATRNQVKHRYRIIIGNTSKYAPGASSADRSTHTWLLYVRGAAAVLRAVAVRLHHSYAPHHLVRIDKPPFQVSRRGWGEFPARVELHFALPARNPPAALDHTIRLDRHRTGLQTLGAETVVDVWLYSTPEMLEHEYKEDIPPSLPLDTGDKEDSSDKQTDDNSTEPTDVTDQLNDTNNSEKLNDSWLEFFSKDSTELNVDEMLIKDEDIKKEAMDYESIENNPSLVLNDKLKIESNSEKSILYNQLTKESNKEVKLEPAEELPNEILKQPECFKKRIMKYMDPTTNKIYYLEMDRELDLSKVQEIVINSQGNVKTAKISPIKSNGLKHVRKYKNKMSIVNHNNVNETFNNYSHIENDHCYVKTSTQNIIIKQEEMQVENDMNKDIQRPCDEGNLYNMLCAAVLRFPCVRMAVSYLLKKIPLITVKAKDPDFVKYFPFVVESEDIYWKLDFAKRRNIEWSRAKLINKLMVQLLVTDDQIWRTKQILIYSRLHGYHPVRSESIPQPTSQDWWTSWNLTDTHHTDTLPDSSSNWEFNSLTIFNGDEFANSSMSESVISESDEEIDIVNSGSAVKVKSEVIPETSLEVMPVESEEDRLRFLFVEKKCADIGIELRNEDVGNGYSYSAVHAVLVSAVRSLAEELVRSARAAALAPDPPAPPALPHVWTGSGRVVCAGAREVCAGARRSSRLQALTARWLAAPARTPHTL
ncbi:YEATS domain-containing protein 2 [Papilio xuthus]|uniref:YEATS domain-containing protein 2 n=1 Tax=Papilio xuthus TaxID=66420 RepID=A0A194PTF9_PAPXU|nr:YEATS domain-containing protein 2 [Papilio xuthus]